MLGARVKAICLGECVLRQNTNFRERGPVVGDGSRLVRARTVTGDGEGLVSRAGLVLLAEPAEAVGLAEGLRQATRALG